jgi:4-hydroxy-tetrahydrodipicolinate reductase
MKTELNIFVAGANGRMGQQIIRQVIQDQELRLAGASEHPDCPVLGADAGLNAGTRQVSISITSDLRRSLEKNPGIVIDFSSVESTLENLKRAVDFKSPVVIGTTGFSPEQIKTIKEASQKVAIMFAPNMSVAMNVMFKLVSDAAKVLKDEFDIEILELHHRDKTDAPSGTALKLAKTACEASGRDFLSDVRYQRHGQIGARSKKEVGVQTIRGGDVVGEHTAFYFTDGERLEIKHVATSRLTFASGAIRAAKWLQGKPAGLYDMEDVLGIR